MLKIRNILFLIITALVFFSSPLKAKIIDGDNIIIHKKDISCKNGEDGSIQIYLVNTETPLHLYINSTQYSFNNNQFILSNVAAGSYRIKITQETKIVKDTTFILSEPEVELNAYILSKANVRCNNEKNGFVELSATGGTGDYTFVWNDGKIANKRSTLSYGYYQVTVTDANTCTDTLSLSIEEPQSMNISSSVTNVNCPTEENGSISLEVSGGTPFDFSEKYIFRWSNSQNTPTISNLRQGLYSYTVTDANNCNKSGYVNVKAIKPLCFKIPSAFSPNGDGINDYWEIPQLHQEYPNATIQVHNNRGELVFSSTGYEEPWDGQFNGKYLPLDTYYYVIKLNNFSNPIVGEVTILR